MKKSFFLKSVYEYYYTIDGIELLIEYLIGKNNNKREAKKVYDYLEDQIPLESLLPKTIKESNRIMLSNPILFLLTGDLKNHSAIEVFKIRIQKNLIKMMKKFLINKISNDLLSLLASLFYLSCLFDNLFIIDNLYDRAYSMGKSNIVVLIMYYVILPLFAWYIDDHKVLDDFLEKKISSYIKPLTSEDIAFIETKLKEILRDDYRISRVINKTESVRNTNTGSYYVMS